MRFRLFYHSLHSCWNHGNAHFLRGIAAELLSRGHEVEVWQPANGWSAQNLIAEDGGAMLAQARAAFAHIPVREYEPETFDAGTALEGADVVIVHEWTHPRVVEAIAQARRTFQLWFHDTHHRAVTAPHELLQFPLNAFEGMLLFGASLKDAYARLGFRHNTHVWHEAADERLFFPCETGRKRSHAIFIGNWGDDERSAELETFLFTPIRKLAITLTLHGVRYPQSVLQRLAQQGVHYEGYLPNHHAPEAYARALFSVHVPRRAYSEALTGIPTIRVFEAMACGLPLIIANWRDTERLFSPASYLHVTSGAEMQQAMRDLIHDSALRRSLIRSGLEEIRERHNCRVRTDQLLNILCEAA